MFFAVYVLSITSLLAYSQLMLKWRLDRLPSLKFGHISDLKEASMLFFDPLIISCFLALGIAAILYMSMLPKYALNLIFPFMSLNIVLVIIGSSFFLGESLTPLKIAGVATIVIGVAVAAQG